ncbi:MAG: 1-acyl-sn-glycerol-3-phosphate acyltransferase [Rhodospirillaceae bacterium]|nr:1-acyl-sn-glycerol-3-phosphate acyltransferase [Rhodospirillaceae bacterium]
MTVLRSIAFWTITIVFTLAISLAALFTLPFPRDVTYRWCVAWARVLLWLMRMICGLDVRVLGRGNIQQGRAVYALKHQSAWETIAFLAIAPPVAGVLKKELLAIPIYGWYMRRLGMVPIDRKAAGAALRDMLRRAKDETEHGRSIMIMPEGTRLPPGRTGRYHPGVAALYSMLGLPVVPVALNSGLFWGRRSLVLRPGTVTLEFLEPIPAGMERKAFMALLQERIETASERLRLEALKR